MPRPTQTPAATPGEATLAAYIANLSPDDQVKYNAGLAALTPAPMAKGRGRAAPAVIRTPVPWHSSNGTRKVVKIRDADDVSADAQRFTPEQAKSLSQRMQKVGMLDEGPVTRVDFENAWDDLVGLAVKWHSSNPKSMLSPYDMLDLYFGHGDTHNNGKGTFTGAGKNKAVTAARVVQRDMQVSTNDDARSLLSNMITRELGRRPSAKEIDDFQAALNDAQRKNPYVTTQYTGASTLSGPGDASTQVTRDTTGKATRTSSTKTGGVDPNQFADKYFQDKYQGAGLDSEYGQYQAATTYMSALMQALKGTA